MNRFSIVDEYRHYIGRKRLLLLLMLGLLPLVFFHALTVGPVKITVTEIVRILLGYDSDPVHVRIVYHFRLPQALAALFAGAGLATAGTTMQAVLRNPLCSPFTLGISSAAAFGAALVIFLRDGTVAATGIASSLLGSVLVGSFVSSLIATGVILILAAKRSMKPETIILIGVALGAFYASGIMMLQYFATARQLVAMTYWTFGDTHRATWPAVITMGIALLLSTGYFISQSWNYNTLALGEENARALGVLVERVRLGTMFFASLLTSVLVTMLGVIGFVGLVVPHLIRICVGSDYRFVLPCSFLGGALLLLSADTLGRTLSPDCLMPVSILTAFLGGPIFLLMLIQRKEQ